VVSPSPCDRQSADESAVNPLVAFFDIHDIKRKFVIFPSVPDTAKKTLNVCLDFHLLMLGFSITRISNTFKLDLIVLSMVFRRVVVFTRNIGLIEQT
jgi:hypothetical protein